mgnify:CR=1 FL=1|tara:strand:- start:2190 stop:3092 length:903 start_codon:yes stop_codon:yes gene_type:complete
MSSPVKDLADKAMGTSSGSDSTINSASKDFLQSNNLITKFAFILGILIIFMYVLRFVISFIGWMFTPSNSPYLIKGISDANDSRTINVDPNEYKSKPIMRSNNELKGIEFTWSVWLYINELSSGGNYKPIFVKGDTTTTYGDLYLNSGPGLYISTTNNVDNGNIKNQIKVAMNVYNQAAQEKGDLIDEVIVGDIPHKKWVNVMIRCEGNMLDIFINGMIVKRQKLKGIPRQNYHNIHVSPDGPPFDGYISDLRYWNESLGTNAIYNIISNGPNTKNFDNSANSKNTYPRYFATSWFTKMR